jgi:hypothetical protein
MSWTTWNGDILKRMSRQAMGDALVRAGEATQGVILQQVPLDEGTLAATVQVMQDPGNPLHVGISAGGGAGTGFPRVPYAIKWHETPANFQHNRKHNYVRDPINQFASAAVRKELTKAAKETW